MDSNWPPLASHDHRRYEMDAVDGRTRDTHSRLYPIRLACIHLKHRYRYTAQRLHGYMYCCELKPSRAPPDRLHEVPRITVLIPFVLALGSSRQSFAVPNTCTSPTWSRYLMIPCQRQRSAAYKYLDLAFGP